MSDAMSEERLRAVDNWLATQSQHILDRLQGKFVKELRREVDRLTAELASARAERDQARAEATGTSTFAHESIGRMKKEIEDMRLTEKCQRQLDAEEAGKLIAERDTLAARLREAVGLLEPLAEKARNPDMKRYVIDGEERLPAKCQSVSMDTCQAAAAFLARERGEST